jgi:hypothetical protein
VLSSRHAGQHDEACRRAEKDFVVVNRDSAGKKRRPISGPEKYRGVEYVVAKQGEGTWAWRLQAKTEHGAQTISGTTRLGQNEAIEAAHRAIDELLGTKRK